MKIEQYTITSPSFTGSVNIISIPIHSTTTTNQPKIKNVYKSSKNKQTKTKKQNITYKNRTIELGEGEK